MRLAAALWSGCRGRRPAVIARDLLLLRSIPCDMAGIGPFIAHPATDLRGCPNGSTELTKRAVSLARLLLPGANLPATTALGVLDSGEKSDVFSCGANVVMKKLRRILINSFTKSTLLLWGKRMWPGSAGNWNNRSARWGVFPGDGFSERKHEIWELIIPNP